MQHHCHFVCQQSPNFSRYPQLLGSHLFHSVTLVLSVSKSWLSFILNVFSECSPPGTHPLTAMGALQNALLLAYWSQRLASPALAQPLPQLGCPVLSSFHLVKSLTIPQGSLETALTSFHTDFHQLWTPGTCGFINPAFRSCPSLMCVLSA